MATRNPSGAHRVYEATRGNAEALTERSVVEEASLIRGVPEGDGPAARALDDGHVDRVYRLGYRMAGEDHVVRDFTQEMFVRAFGRIEEFRGDAAFAAWLWAIAFLPEDYRTVFLMHDLEGSTHEEIATAPGVRPGTSESRLFRARAPRDRDRPARDGRRAPQEGRLLAGPVGRPARGRVPAHAHRATVRGRSVVRARGSVALAVALLQAGCGGDRAESGWAGAVDTLPGGALRVSSPAEGIWPANGGWEVREDLRIGALEGTGPEVLGRVAALAVDEAGRIYAAESQALEVRVFGPDGTHVRTIGRKGGGPGEFEDVSGLLWGPEGHLWLVDQRNGRYAVFDTAGAFLAHHRRRVGGMFWPWPGGFDPDGRLVDVTFGRESTAPALVIGPPAGGPTDTVSVPAFEGPTFELTEGGRRIMTAPVPFAPTLRWRYDSRGFLWWGVTGRYRLHQVTLAGDTVRIVERAWDPVPVSPAERDSAVAAMEWFTRQGGVVEASRIPDGKPAFRHFHQDDRGHLWVVPSLPASPPVHAADLFDPEGRYLGRLELPFDLPFAPVVFRDDRLYTVVQDEAGVPQLVRAAVLR